MSNWWAYKFCFLQNYLLYGCFSLSLSLSLSLEKWSGIPIFCIFENVNRIFIFHPNLMCFFTFELIVLKKKSFKREIAPIKCIIFLIQARNVQMMY